jgi:trypsin
VSEITKFPKRAKALLNDFDTPCKLLGKGYTQSYYGDSSRKLKLAYVKPVPRSECQYEWKRIQSTYELKPKSLCAIAVNGRFCLGDSGGPLFCNEELTGVVSFSFECGKYPPMVFADIYYFNDWIDSVINDS